MIALINQPMHTKEGNLMSKCLVTDSKTLRTKPTVDDYSSDIDIHKNDIESITGQEEHHTKKHIEG